MIRQIIISLFFISCSVILYGQKSLIKAEGLINKGEYNEAKQMLSETLKIDAKNAEANYLMGYCNLLLNNSHLALNYFKKAYKFDEAEKNTTHKVNKQLDKLLNDLTADLEPYDKENLKIKLGEELLKDSPNNPAILLQIAEAMDALNQFENANKAYLDICVSIEEDAKNYKKEGAAACYRLADEYYFRQSNTETAIKYIDEGLKLKPDSKELIILRVIITEREHKSEPETEERYKELLRVFPESEKLLLLYASFLEDIKPFESIIQYEKLLKLNPNNQVALYALGMLYTGEATKLQVNKENSKKILELMNAGIVYMETLHSLNPYDTLTINTLIRFYGYVNRDEDAEKMKLKLK